MKTLVLSDLHVDFFFSYAVKPSRLKLDDPKADVVSDTLNFMWDFYQIPVVDRLVLGGDYSNDYLTFTRLVPWLSEKYKEVYLVLGNHDLTVKGATTSKSNHAFVSSEKKIEAMKEVCGKYGNVHLLDGDVVDGIGGCMGMCDFRCEPPSYGLDPFTNWKRNWYDGKFWRYFNQEPGKIWSHYEQKLSEIVKQKPKLVVTHFIPYEQGIPHKFRNSPWNYVFYFKGQQFFDELDDGAYWVCGHTHDCKRTEFVNSKGNRIHILCNPIGYPGEHSSIYAVDDYTGETLKRTETVFKFEDFIIDF